MGIGRTASAMAAGACYARPPTATPLWDGTGWYDDARITRQVCRITWWTGNPFVNETIPGVKFDLKTAVLRRDADAGRVGVLTALTK